MKRLTKNLWLRSLSLPYALLLLAVIAGYGFVAVGRAGEGMEETVSTAPRLAVTDPQLVRV